jgi:hypothetical protein
MVRSGKTAAWLGCAAALATIAACHTIAGVEDKQLDPALGEAGTEAGPEASAETGTDAQDAPSDVTAEVSDTGPEDTFARPPLRPAGDASPSDAGRTLTLAVRRYFIGTVDPDTDDNDLDAWRRLGFDYDGECTTKQQSADDLSNTCKRPSGAEPTILEDGEKCRDNLGGNMLSQALAMLDQSFEKKAHNGTWNCTKATMILLIEDLDDGPDDPYAPGRLYVTAPRDPSQPMLWDGNDVLLVDSDSVLNGSVGEPKYTAPRGFVRNHVWMNDDFRGPPTVMPMMVLSRVAPVPTETATIAVRLEEDHVEARGAMFSAVIDTVGLQPFLRAGMMEATGCSEALTDMALARFLPNLDLARSDTFVKPGEECEFLSFGGWFELKRVQTPKDAVEVPVPPSCDGGT